MKRPCDFEWDEHKAAVNLAGLHIAFDVAAAVFSDPSFRIIDTTREADREERGKAIGMIDERLFAVVFTMRGEVIRIISARRANAKEERFYGNRQTQD